MTRRVHFFFSLLSTFVVDGGILPIVPWFMPTFVRLRTAVVLALALCVSAALLVPLCPSVSVHFRAFAREKFARGVCTRWQNCGREGCRVAGRASALVPFGLSYLGWAFVYSDVTQRPFLGRRSLLPRVHRNYM